MIKYKKGDLIKESNSYDILIHGCNCFNTMGAGIALQIKNNFPEVYLVDNNTKYGDKSKIGTFTEYKYPNFTVINAYTQYGFGFVEKGMCQTESNIYRQKAIQSVFKNIKTKYGNQGLRFVFPLIGAGLAGGDWTFISKLVEAEMKDEDLTCIIWERDTENLNKFNL